MRRRLLEALADLRYLFTVLSWPQYGCIFWSDQSHGDCHGDCFGHYESWEAFNKELADNFRWWKIEKPVVIVGPAWRVRLIQWLLRARADRSQSPKARPLSISTCVFSPRRPEGSDRVGIK